MLHFLIFKSKKKLQNNPKKISKIDNPWDQENILRLRPSIEFRDELIEIFFLMGLILIYKIYFQFRL